MKSMESIRKQCKWLLENAGKPVRIKTLRNIPGEQLLYDPGITDGTLPSEPEGNRLIALRCRLGSVNLQAWAISWVTYDLTGISEADLALRVGLGVFGVANPARVLWEAIPYSFVVDWLINVDQVVRLLDGFGASLSKKVSRTTSHVRVTVNVEARARLFGWITWPTEVLISDTDGGSMSRCFYERQLGVPTGGLALMDPSVRELILALYLGDQLGSERARRFNGTKATFARIRRRLSRWRYHRRFRRRSDGLLEWDYRAGRTDPTKISWDWVPYELFSP